MNPRVSREVKRSLAEWRATPWPVAGELSVMLVTCWPRGKQQPWGPPSLQPGHSVCTGLGHPGLHQDLSKEGNVGCALEMQGREIAQFGKHLQQGAANERSSKIGSPELDQGFSADHRVNTAVPSTRLNSAMGFSVHWFPLYQKKVVYEQHRAKFDHLDLCCWWWLSPAGIVTLLVPNSYLHWTIGHVLTWYG